MQLESAGNLRLQCQLPSEELEDGALREAVLFAQAPACSFDNSGHMPSEEGNAAGSAVSVLMRKPPARLGCSDREMTPAGGSLPRGPQRNRLWDMHWELQWEAA